MKNKKVYTFIEYDIDRYMEGNKSNKHIIILRIN